MSRSLRAARLVLGSALLLLSGAFCVGLAPCAQRGAADQRKEGRRANPAPWEFKAVSFGSDEKENTGKLNLLAADGWEYVGPLGNGMVAFKRRRTPEATVGEIRCFKGHWSGVLAVAFSPDGRLALSGGQDTPALRLWDVATGKELRHFEVPGAVHRVAFSPDGKQALSAGDGATIQLWDVATGQELRRFQGHANRVTGVAFSPDGKFVVSGSQDGTLHLWDAATAREVRRFEGHRQWVYAVAFSPDGRRILSGSNDKTVRLWDLETGQELRVFEGHTDHVWNVCFSPDGRWGLSAGKDRTVRLWDLDTGKEFRKFEGSSAGFSPDGRRVLSCNDDNNTVRLWDVQTGKELHNFVGHTEGVRQAIFSPDGRYALTGAADRTLRLWRLPPAIPLPPPPAVPPKLLKARLEAAEEGYRLARQALIQQEKGNSVQDVALWSQRVLEAKRPFSKDKQEETAAVQQHLDRLKDLEAMTRKLFQTGAPSLTASDLASVRYHRIEAEIMLSQLEDREGAGKEGPSKPAAPK